MSRDDTRNLGPAEVRYLGQQQDRESPDFDGRLQVGLAHRFRIRLATEPALIAEWTTWDRQARDGAARVRWLEGREGEGCPRHYHQLGVYPHPDADAVDGDRVLMLRLQKPKLRKPHERSLQMTTLEEIAHVSGVAEPEAALRRWGATHVGTRAEIRWPALRMNGHLAIRFPKSAAWATMASLLLCVVLPCQDGSGTGRAVSSHALPDATS